MHHIQKVKDGENIDKEEVPVDQFAVKLTITHDFKPEDTLQDEMRRYFDHFVGVRRDEADLTELLDSDNRVTFIRGIAGMGKTVLAKQLVWGWVNDKLYTNYKFCIMFECREVNYFVKSKGTENFKYGQLRDFLKETFHYDFEDSENSLFVIDGVDELYDINEDNSMIWQLLDKKSRYSRSKIILTGRPHVEGRFKDQCVGGIQKFEIQGLTEKRVNEYINIFTSCEDHVESISKARRSSRGKLQILHVPQFLNTFCCVAILSGGEGIHSTAELYSWAFYLLLKEHAGKQESSKEEVFHKYSQEMKNLANVCYELLKQNKIIFEGDLEKKLGKSEKCENFFESLFVDKSKPFRSRYQFKHLTIMEFLSALHICVYLCADLSEKRMNIIKEALEKGYIDIVVYTCELIAGVSCSGIVRELLKCIADVRKPDVMLNSILKEVQDCNLRDGIKFERSLDILASILTSDGISKKFLLSRLKDLDSGPLFKSSVKDSNSMCEITEFLQEDLNCSADELCLGLRNVCVGEFIVNDVDTILGAKYLGSVHIVSFSGMKINIKTARSKLEESIARKCTLVWIEECEITENEIEDSDNGKHDSTLDELVIWDSKLSKDNFIHSSNWGTSSKKLFLDQIKVKEGWWQILAEAVKRKSDTRELVLKELIIKRCNTSMKEKYQTKVKYQLSNIIFKYSTK